MSKLVEFGKASVGTRATYFQGKFLDGSCAQLNGNWYWKTSDLDTTQPLRPSPMC